MFHPFLTAKDRQEKKTQRTQRKKKTTKKEPKIKPLDNYWIEKAIRIGILKEVIMGL